MADSLVLGGTIELLGGGVASTNPLCPGAVFQLQQGADPGAPQPTTDFIASLILDGERPFGRRASNRTITLPIWITAPSRLILAAAREVLESVVDQDKWVLTWTRDPGPGGTPLPMLLDCFRAQPTKPVFATWMEKQLTGMMLTLTIPALPYGRSDVQQQIQFASPVPAAPPPPPAPVVLETFTSIASPRFSQSPQCVIGPWTGCWDPDSFGDPGGQVTPLTYGATFGAPLSLSGLTAVQLWVGLGTRYYWALEHHHRTTGVAVAFTFTDSSGAVLSFARSNVVLPVTPNWDRPVFTRVTVRIPQGSGEFNYASVASWQVVITNRQHPLPRFAWVTCYLDHVTAVPGSQQLAPVTRGYVYTLNGIVGTARGPMALTIQQPPGPGTPFLVTSAGPGNYTVPAGTSWLSPGCIGGGGAGGSMDTAGQGGGGEGGEYAGETNFPAQPGQVIPFTVGAGAQPGTGQSGQPTVFGPGPQSSMQVFANGGQSALTDNPAGAGDGPVSGNSTEYSGGSGYTAAGGLAGGGGSSAGPSSDGNTPVGTGSVVYATSASWQCPQGVYIIFAEVWGAGAGAGCGGFSGYGSGGGGGEYRAAWLPVTPGTNYPFTIGQGGAGASGIGTNGSPGTATSFTTDGGATVLANGGQGGPGNQWSPGHGGLGGSNGIGQYGYNGGRGGNAYPYSGGGGSSAGPGAQGNQGGSPSGAAAPQGGGQGGSGSGARAGNGLNGQAPGGGGGGTYQSGYTAGSGANGQLRLTYPSVTGAPTSAGGIAVPGGGAGGSGGSYPGAAGTAGSAPGGAGGGASSGGTSVPGGAGAQGSLSVTPYASQPFRTLIVHRPPLGALKMFAPLVSVGAGNDAPDGTHQYTMPQPLAGVNASFGGTYTIYLVNSSFSGSGQRTVSVTVTQYEFAGGPAWPQATIPVVITPSQVTNGLLCAGVLTLPGKAVAADNSAGYYTVSVTDSNTSDRWIDCIFLDSQGQTVILNKASAGGYVTYYIDPPDPDRTLGYILGSQGGRASAISVMDACTAISGGPLCVEPADGDNQLFLYCADGVAPAVGVTYSPRWFFDRYE